MFLVSARMRAFLVDVNDIVQANQTITVTAGKPSLCRVEHFLENSTCPSEVGN